MDISVMSKSVKFSIEAKHPLCAKLLARAGLLLSDSELANVIRTKNIMKVNSSPNGRPCKINYQYFKRDHYQDVTDCDKEILENLNFELEFALAVRDLLDLNAEDCHHWKVTYKVKKRDIAYETVAEFSVVFFNSKEDKEAVESFGYPYNDGYVD